MKAKIIVLFFFFSVFTAFGKEQPFYYAYGAFGNYSYWVVYKNTPQYMVVGGGEEVYHGAFSDADEHVIGRAILGVAGLQNVIQEISLSGTLSSFGIDYLLGPWRRDPEKWPTRAWNQSCDVIGEKAFSGFKNLRTVYFTDKLSYIGDNAFEGCDRLYVDINFKAGHIPPTLFPNSFPRDEFGHFRGVVRIGSDDYDVYKATYWADFSTFYVRADKISLDKKEVELYVNYDPADYTVQLNATLPEHASNKNVEWLSADPATVHVDQSGKLTARKAGTATIYAKTVDGAQTSCQVTVYPFRLIRTMEFEKPEFDIYTETELPLYLYAVLNGDPDRSAGDHIFSCTSSNPYIVEADDKGYIRTKNAFGSATVTLTAVNYGISASCKVNVVPAETTHALIYDIYGKPLLYMGDKYQFTHFSFPYSVKNQKATWSSSNPSVASVVDTTGEVTALNEGETVISVTSVYKKDIVGSRKLTVVDPIIHVTGIEIDRDKIGLYPKDSVQLHLNILPDNATSSSVAWESDDPAVASVSAFGLVTAVSPGVTVIRSSLSDFDMPAECEVTVMPNALLDSLDVEGSVLSPAFQQRVFEYNAYIRPYTLIDSVVINVVAEDGVSVSGTGAFPIPDANTVFEVKVQSGNEENTYKINVQVPEVKSVVLNRSNITLIDEETFQLTATITPIRADNKNLRWESDHPEVAEVSSKGVVTAISTGYAAITVTAEDGGVAATCTVVVLGSSDATLKSLKVSQGTLINHEFDPLIFDYEVKSLGVSPVTISVEAHPRAFVTGQKTTVVNRDTTLVIGVYSENRLVENEYNISVTGLSGNTTTGISNPGIETAQAYFEGQTLYVNTPAAERITVYSVTGNRLYSREKAAGKTSLSINSQRQILIVRGSSGWVKKLNGN
jgi:uncharacterized protein YjdB